MERKKDTLHRRVLVGGCFDILHYGHIYFLREAKKLGDYLTVLLESDANVKRLKGASRPIHSQKQRKEILESLTYVDEVIILKEKMTDEDYKRMVFRIKPQIIAVTEGFSAKTHAQLVGAKVVKIPKIKVPSTTKIARLIKLE